MEQTSKTPWGTTEGLYDPSFEHDQLWYWCNCQY